MPQEFKFPATEPSSPHMEPSGDPYAQRVTPDEFSAALAALEGKREAQAHYEGGTLSIGQTVDELGLSVPPEDIWREVQRQRFQKEQALLREHVLSGSFVQTSPVPVPCRHWRRWAVGALAAIIMGRLLAVWNQPLFVSTRVVNTPPTTVTTTSGNVLTINGNRQVRTIKETGGPIVASGNGNTLTINGSCDQLVVSGNSNTVKLYGSAQAIIFSGDDNNVTYPTVTHPQQVVDNGSRNFSHPR